MANFTYHINSFLSMLGVMKCKYRVQLMKSIDCQQVDLFGSTRINVSCNSTWVLNISKIKC